FRPAGARSTTIGPPTASLNRFFRSIGPASTGGEPGRNGRRHARDQEMSSMISADDLSPLYGPYYFRSYCQAPYERSAKWLAVFGSIADGIIREIGPRTVLDAGCAMGFLVESLRDRGVEAHGFD